MQEKIVETRICKQCSLNFDITDKDLEFYDKISPIFNGEKFGIPTPTLCPDCREQRRLVFRNERNLYKRKCDLTGKDIISVYSPDKPYKVYEQSEWWSDKWDVMDYWLDFDFVKNSFGQFKELYSKIPKQSLFNINMDRSDFCNNCLWLKDSYLSFWVTESEKILYSTISMKLVNCIDVSFSIYSSNSYYITDCINVNFSSFINNCENSNRLQYCYDCVWCNDCIFSYWLRNKQYFILNKQLSKKDYFIELDKIFWDKKNKAEMIKLYKKWLSNFPRVSSYFVSCEDCTGNILFNSKNSKNCYDSVSLENCKNINNSSGSVNSFDVYALREWSDLIYNSINVSWFLCAFSFEINKCNNIYYSFNCYNCSNIFLSIWLKNKSYCILNKQYTKEEYEELVPKIIKQMMKTWEWWDFFSASLSSFWYNETVAQEYYPFSKNEAIKKWFNWSDYEQEFPKVEKIISANKLPENIKDIPDDILNWAIECEVTKKPFRIIKQELEFYRKYNLPIPKRHPDQRHLDRMALKNPRKLFDRKCDKCWVEMQTTYAPDRKEIVYCEECYNKEIY